MRYGMVINSLAHMHTGTTVRIKSTIEGFYVLADGEHCHAMPTHCVELISEECFNFFIDRTEVMKKFLENND